MKGGLQVAQGWQLHLHRQLFEMNEIGHQVERSLTLAFVLVPQSVLTTSTHVVAWPQGDQFLGGGAWHKAILPTTQWFSLPLHTPVGAWSLSQSTWVQRWRGDHGF